MSTSIKQYKPSRPLQPFVEYFWKGDFNDVSASRLSQKVIPNGYVEIIIHLTDLHCDLYSREGWLQSPDYTIIGLFTRPYEVRFSGYVKTFGIRLKPEGTYNIFNVPASEFCESYEDITLVLGRNFRSFCDSLRDQTRMNAMIGLAENYLLKQMERNRNDIGYVNQAAELIRETNGALRIDHLPRKVFISQRQLEREFKNRIGISPKHYLRIARLNEVHRLLQESNRLNFTELAHSLGYTDQAHFIRDFKNITGVNPSIFVKGREQFLVNVGQER